jgi:hypothetical protein
MGKVAESYYNVLSIEFQVSVREWDMGKVAEDEDKSRDADRRDRKRKDRHRSESGEPDGKGCLLFQLYFSYNMVHSKFPIMGY